MLEATGLEKSFGRIKVTNNISMRVEAGERRVILGPNGAGKTTLFGILVGEIRPTAGTITLAQRDVTRDSVAVRARLGLARSYQRNNLFDDLSVRENLALAVATSKGAAKWLLRDTLADREIGAVVEEVACLVGLADLLGSKVNAISYGARRQLEVGLALATRPRVLLMDEPTSGVGPEMIRSFERLLQSLPREITVVIIEHDMDIALEVADRVTVLNHGEIVFEGTPEETRHSDLVNEIYLGGGSRAGD
jgi:ABC-type branched-subunit amino acid transport system ATPase component